MRPKKNPPAYMEVLKYLSLLNPSTALPAAFGMAVDEGKRRLAENIDPHGYVLPEQRIYDALISNKPEMGSYSDFNSEGHLQPSALGSRQERIDLFNMYLGRDQPYGSIPESEYGSKDNPLYGSPTTERTLKTIIEDAYSDEMRNSGRYRNTSSADWHPIDELKSAFSKPDYHEPLISNRSQEGNVLGNFTAKIKEDDKGTYVEYQDEWDLDPFPGLEKAGLMPLIEKVAGVNPPKIYGRIYFDPETGEIKD